MKKYFLFVFVFTILSVSTFSFAQTKLDTKIYDKDGFLLESKVNSNESKNVSELTEEEINEFESLLTQKQIDVSQNAKDGEIASCFDYYSFGSIAINLTQNYGLYNAGDPVVIKGTITNNNPYPIVGLDIKARLVKDIPQPNYFRSEIIVLEDIEVLKNVTIEAGQKYEVSYSHLLPLNAPSGKYQMYFYAVEQDRYNLSGLSFTNDILGSKIAFEVKGNERNHIYLDQTQITVGGQPHNVMGFMTQHSSSTSIPVSIRLSNPSKESKDMTITYKLYSWDSAKSTNLIDTKTEQVIVEANSEKQLTYTLDKGTLPVYYLSIESKPTNQTRDESVFKETTKSNIRFVIRNTSLPRLNFSALNTYPLVKGEDATIVSCFHNTNEGEAPYAKIETILKDKKGKVLAQSLYEGSVPPDITAIRKKFNSKSNQTEFTLSTIMYDQNNKIIDQVDKVYSCKDINPDLCPKESKISTVMVGIIIVLVALAIVFFTRRKMNNIERV